MGDKASGAVKANMGAWKQRQRRKAGKGSQTHGKMKNPATCQASGLDRYMAKRNRSYKHPLYGAWCERKRG